MEVKPVPDYDELLQRIAAAYDAGRVRAVQAVNVQLLETYWQVGRHIVEFEQGGQAKADYGAGLISRLARDLGLIDLKIDDVEDYDIGQMNLYLGYFAAEENTEGDAEPVGIILNRHKDELLVEYAIYGMNSPLFVQKYQLYLPNREELRRELERTLQEADE